MSTLPELPTSIIFTILALCFILVLAWIVIKFLSRVVSSRALGGEIKVKSTYALGTRQQLYVVNFRDKDYLLGVTPEQIGVIDTCPALSPNLDEDKNNI